MAKFCAERLPLAVARATADGLDRGRWGELAEMGLFSLALPVDGGGAGLLSIDAVLAFEQLGRVVAPGPLVAAFLAAGIIPGVATGEVVPTVVERSKSPGLVEHLGDAEVVVILDDDGVSVVAVTDLNAVALAHPLDPTTPLWLVRDLPSGDRLEHADVEAWRRKGSLLVSALLVGLASGATTLALHHARSRHQFARPIGSFQAVKHILADMFARSEVSRAALYAAGVVVDDPDAGDVQRAVAAARVVAGNAALDNGRSCVQVHGGMGFTWEADPHLYLKRALLHDTQFGSIDEAAELVAQRLAR